MQKKEFLELFKYKKFKSADQAQLRALQRTFSAKMLKISHKLRKTYINPKDNIEGLNYAIQNLIDYGVNKDFIQLNYNFSLTNTKFIEFYVKMDNKYYLICYNQDEKEDKKATIELLEFLKSN